VNGTIGERGRDDTNPMPREPQWQPPDPGTWTADSSHQTEPVTATLRALMPTNYAAGFKHSFAQLGLPLSHIAIAFVEGWTYTSVFAHGARRGGTKQPPELVLKLVTRLHPGFRRRTRRAAAALADDLPLVEAKRWLATRQTWIDGNLELEDVPVAQLDDRALARHVLATAERLADGLYTHFALFAPAAVVGEYLLAADRWGIDRSLASTAVLHGTPSTQEAERRLDALVDELGPTQPTTLDQVRAHSPRAAELLDEFLRHHGGWSLADDLNAQCLIEVPDVTVRMINARRRRRSSNDVARLAADALDSVRAGLPSSERPIFDALAERAQCAYASLDDNSGLTASWPLGLARRAQIEAARRLTHRGKLADTGDVWTLTPDEISGLLTGAAAPDASEIARRAAERAWQHTLTPPPVLGAAPTPPPDPRVFPTPVAELTRRVLTFVDAKFGDDERAFGVGTEPVRGRAVVVTSAHEALERLEPGDILVTPTTTPAHNVVLPLAAGLVTSFGGPNSHPAIVARELGIPAIVGWRDATERIADGARIEIDPSIPSVTVLASDVPEG
jgi:phosphohistidine swiveling domain-containing protein